MKRKTTKIAAEDILTKEKSQERILAIVFEAMDKAQQERFEFRGKLDRALFAAFETVKERGEEVARDSFPRLYERNLELYRKRIPKSLFGRAHAQRWAATRSVRGCFQAYWAVYLDECRKIFEDQLSDLESTALGFADWEWGNETLGSMPSVPHSLADRQRSEEEEKLKYLVWDLDSRPKAKDKPKSSKARKILRG